MQNGSMSGYGEPVPYMGGRGGGKEKKITDEGRVNTGRVPKKTKGCKVGKLKVSKKGREDGDREKKDKAGANRERTERFRNTGEGRCGSSEERRRRLGGAVEDDKHEDFAL